MAAQTARILIVARSDAESASLQRCVAGNARIVAVVDESRDLMATVSEFAPHLVLLVAQSNIAAICRQCRELKSKHPGTFVMATCSLNGLDEIERLVDAGADDFLSGLIDEAELRKRADNLLCLAGRL